MTDPMSWAADGSIRFSKAPLAQKEFQLRERLRSYGRVLVAFSGGCDSALVLKIAVEELGRERVWAVTTRSESLSRRELPEVKDFTERYAISHHWIRTREIEDPNYAQNPTNRCYYCKSELYHHLLELASHWDIPVLLNGTNADDLGDWRPGLEAAREHKVKSPLAEVGMRKKDVRELSRRLGLSTWDKPAAPCLSSRFAYGQQITPAGLRRIDSAEEVVKALGFRVVRVRFLGDRVRVEVGADEVERLNQDQALQQLMIREISELGFDPIEISSEGYKSGILNQGIVVS